MLDLLQEDVGYVDLTTHGLNIGEFDGVMRFYARSDITICGLSQVVKILNSIGLDFHLRKKDGEKVLANELILDCYGSAEAIHKAWKISQNVLEYLSGIATTTNKILTLAKEINPKIELATTRKNFPGVKELMVQAVFAGGGTVHRLGLYDSILVFKEHLEFVDDVKLSFKMLREKFLEKKITVEVANLEEAKYFASIGADILQCEKMSFEELTQCVELKNE
ncbi:MAG: hypothetical protein RL154_1073, partial [Pseudomonadota bacterium]